MSSPSKKMKLHNTIVNSSAYKVLCDHRRSLRRWYTRSHSAYVLDSANRTIGNALYFSFTRQYSNTISELLWSVDGSVVEIIPYEARAIRTLNSLLDHFSRHSKRILFPSSYTIDTDPISRPAMDVITRLLAYGLFQSAVRILDAALRPTNKIEKDNQIDER